jgi:hypothetical protein
VLLVEEDQHVGDLLEEGQQGEEGQQEEEDQVYQRVDHQN